MAPPPPSRKRVTVPIKVVVRGGRIAGGGERIGDHVADGTGAQLGRAFDALDDGGAWQPELREFDVKFVGPGADQVSEEQRAAVKSQVADGVARGARVAQARRGKGKGTSRRGGGKPQAKPDKGKGRELGSYLTWAEFDQNDLPTIHASFEAAALEWMEAEGRALDSTYAILFRARGSGLRLWVVHQGNYVCKRGLSTVAWTGKGGKSEAFETDARLTGIHLELEPDGLRVWREGAYKKAETALAKEKGLIGKGSFERGDVNAPAVAHSAEAKALVDNHTADWDTKMRVYYRLKIGGGGSLYPFSNAASPNMPTNVARIDVVPLTEKIDAVAGEEAEDGGAGGGKDKEEDDGSGGDKDDGGGGGADKGKGLGSDITALPGEDVGEGGSGIVRSEKYDPKSKSIFPIVPSDPMAKSWEIPCRPFRDEPNVADLPTGKGEIQELIARIAARLEMDPCPYPAHFCIQAGRMIRIRASQVGKAFTLDESGNFTAEMSFGTLDDKGQFYFLAVDSMAVQYLQHLAGTIPLIRSLIRLVEVHVYPVTRFAPHHWFEDVADECWQASGLIWLLANQVMMAQLLNSSRHGVLQRKGNAEYTRVFTAVCRSQLADQVEMLMLRQALEKFLGYVGGLKGKAAQNELRAHLKIQVALNPANQDRRLFEQVFSDETALAANMLTRLSDKTDYVFKRGLEADVPIGDAGAIVETEGGGWAIRGSDGLYYTKDELDRLLMIRQQVVTSIDPFINSLLHSLVDKIRPLVEDPSQIPDFLDRTFSAMLAKNDEVSRKNKNDHSYAFDHGQIHKASRDAPATVEIAQTRLARWQLSGVHALAHTHVGFRFEHDAFYVSAADKLLGQEYYWRAFAEDMVFIFGIAFTIICPPLGAALSFIGNLALGLEAKAKAEEQELIYGALLDPEQVLSYAEIQIDLFLAKLQIGLSFLDLVPGAGKVVKGLTGLGKKAAKEGAERGVRKLAKEMLMEELRKVGQLSMAKFAIQLAVELAEETVEDKVVDLLLTPIIEQHIATLEKEIAEGRAQ